MNVYPAEIEAALLLHPSVQDAVVIGVSDPKWGESGVAFVVLRLGEDLDVEGLSEFLAKRIAKYKIPGKFIPIAELPRTAYGKVVKLELRKLYELQSPDPSCSRERQ
jgi:fatty-acyl-CoA synthase